jgi:DNA-binding beta-propeller fold protein YncE
MRICAVALLLGFAVARAEPEIHSVSDVLIGHSVGGVTVDLVGNVYVADFGDFVWKRTQDGELHVLVSSGLYGASGNTIDRDGNLLQSNYYSNSVTRIDRRGQTTQFAAGLDGPVGIAIDKDSGEVYVANCRGNSVSRIAVDGTVAPFAISAAFKCPNGLSFDRDGNLYAVNFRDNRMLKVDRGGTVTSFATVSSKGLGHLCFKDDRFYVTATQSHEIYQVTLAGTVTRILGNGERGMVDGAGAKARLSSPNGIACHPWAPRLYVNEFLNDAVSTLPQRAIIREIALDPQSKE